jgi:hypothetical protein
MEHHDDRRAQSQARLQLRSVCGIVAAYAAAREKGEGVMDAFEEIQEGPLAVSVRSDWQAPGSRLKAAEYQILLARGGPAVRITGELDEEQPTTARIEYQDWFTPWQELPTSPEETETLIEYARCFYLGT